jgi:hypothetical protein
MVISRELEEYGSYCWIQSGNSYSGPLTACVILVSTMCLFASCACWQVDSGGSKYPLALWIKMAACVMNKHLLVTSYIILGMSM